MGIIVLRSRLGISDMACSPPARTRPVVSLNVPPESARHLCGTGSYFSATPSGDTLAVRLCQMRFSVVSLALLPDVYLLL